MASRGGEVGRESSLLRLLAGIAASRQVEPTPVVNALLRGSASPIATHAVTRTVRCVSPSINRILETRRRPQSMGEQGPLLVNLEKRVLRERVRAVSPPRSKNRRDALLRAAFDKLCDEKGQLTFLSLVRALGLVQGSAYSEVEVLEQVERRVEKGRQSVFGWPDFECIAKALAPSSHRRCDANRSHSEAPVSPYKSLCKTQRRADAYDYASAPIISELDYYERGNTFEAQRRAESREKRVKQEKSERAATERVRRVLRTDQNHKMNSWIASFNNQLTFVTRSITREKILAVKGERARRRLHSTRRTKAERQQVRAKVNAALQQSMERKKQLAGDLQLSSRKTMHLLEQRGKKRIEKLKARRRGRKVQPREKAMAILSASTLELSCNMRPLGSSKSAPALRR